MLLSSWDICHICFCDTSLLDPFAVAKVSSSNCCSTDTIKKTFSYRDIKAICLESPPARSRARARYSEKE